MGDLQQECTDVRGPLDLNLGIDGLAVNLEIGEIPVLGGLVSDLISSPSNGHT